MRKFSVFFLLLMLWASVSVSKASEYQGLYSEMKLMGVVNYTIFRNAMVGYNKLKADNKDIITLVDFSKPSTEERLYIINMKEKKLIFSSLVSHGENSGENYATTFSNVKNSLMSSLGFYLTENSYTGRNGYSLILNGLERGINHMIRDRGIVMHGAPYSNPSVIDSTGCLGRSQGCLALPQEQSATIIDLIKDGTLIYVHANIKEYFEKSVLFVKDKSL